MTTSTTAEPDLDLADPHSHARPDVARWWRRHREHTPVTWHGGGDGRPGFWAVSRHADVSALLRDNKRLSIERGNLLSTLLAGGDPAGGRMVSVADGPRHKDLRAVIMSAFSQRALDAVAVKVRAFTRRVVADAVDEGVGDFAADVASKVPINTICDLLGIPDADRPRLLALNTRAMGIDTPGHTDADERQARSEIVLYFDELVRRRAAAPGDDVVSLLASAVVDGDPLPVADVVLNCYGLLVAGEETSRYSMTAGVHALTTHPDEWRRLRDGDVPLAAAVEEVLRWATPVMHIGRTAVADVELHGATIRAGDVVTLWTSSANRDETVFTDPDRLDLGRSPNKHLAFGVGPHFCLGVYLARAEIAAVLDALRTTAADVELDGTPRRIYSNVLDGISHLPVAYTPA